MTAPTLADLARQEQESVKFCAASICGRGVRVEYSTGSDDGVPWVRVEAVHRGDWRIDADRLSADVIADLERECEAAEITSDECPGHRGGRISADDIYRSVVLGPARVVGAAA